MKTELETALDVRLHLQKALAERGEDYVYEYIGVPHSTQMGEAPTSDCLYGVYDEKGQVIAPSCIVGHAMVSMGLPVIDLGYIEGFSADGLGDFPAVRELIPASHEYVYISLGKAQSIQDTYNTWGTALAAYDTSCSELIVGYREAIANA